MRYTRTVLGYFGASVLMVSSITAWVWLWHTLFPRQLAWQIVGSLGSPFVIALIVAVILDLRRRKKPSGKAGA